MKKKWYINNGGNFDYTLVHEKRETSLHGFDTFSEAKKKMVTQLKNDLDEAKARLADGRSLQMRDCK